jgi:hypothetical protein
MPRPRTLDPPNARKFFDQLKEVLKHLGGKHAVQEAMRPLLGREAILAALHAHGFRRIDGSSITWDTLLSWQRRTGEPFLIHVNARGLHPGPPLTTLLLLLRWAWVQSPKLAPPWAPTWVPGERALRKRRANGSRRTASAAQV